MYFVSIQSFKNKPFFLPHVKNLNVKVPNEETKRKDNENEANVNSQNSIPMIETIHIYISFSWYMNKDASKKKQKNMNTMYINTNILPVLPLNNLWSWLTYYFLVDILMKTSDFVFCFEHPYFTYVLLPGSLNCHPAASTVQYDPAGSGQ